MVIHAPVDGHELGRILSDQGRREFAEGRPRAAGKGRIVEAPSGAISPQPVTPASLSTRTTSESNPSAESPPEQI